ncbi:recombinase RecA, partial [Pantoea agglomerans]
IGQGKANAGNFLKENAAIADELDVKLREMLLNGGDQNIAAGASANEVENAASEANEDY